MRIGELARQASVNIQTIRFYERVGLLAKPARTQSGYRAYLARDVDRVHFIRSCQEIGFTLTEIREVNELHRVLALRDPAEKLKPKAQANFLAAANRRLKLIEEKIKVLVKMKKDMEGLVETLSGRAKPVCPVSGLAVT